MTKQAFNEILAGLENALEIVEARADPSTFKVHAPDEIDVRAIRKKQGLTQAAFAERYGFTAAAVRDWEQRRRRPEASARILLKVIEHRPDAIQEALSA